MITEAGDYFTKGCGRCARFDTPDCATRHWGRGLARLRAVCLGLGLVETAKWGHPCYMHAGRNVAIIGAFRKDFRLTFFNAALMVDHDRVLERQGPNSRHPDMIRFASDDDVEAMTPALQAYLRQAMEYAEKGLKPPKDAHMPDWPPELSEALDADPVLAAAFHKLTPGRQKSYVLNLNGAKQAETRTRRIAGFRDKIIAGKGALDR